MTKSQNEKHIELNLVMRKDIKLNSKMYENFLGALVESDDPDHAKTLAKYKTDAEVEAALQEEV